MMSSPIAHNIPIREMIEAINNFYKSGYTHVDVLVDEEFTLRIRPSKSKKIKSKNKENGKIIPPDENTIIDLIS
jgi:hypothetical protein